MEGRGAVMCGVTGRTVAHSIGEQNRCARLFFFSSRRRHTRFKCDWSSDVCSSDLFLPNAVEAMAYPSTAPPEDALEALAPRCRTVVVKCGGRGAIAGEDGVRAAAPALPVTALDPTGAGDVFAAGFVFGTLAGWPLEQRLRFANLCAGLSVRHYSGSLGAPCWGEIAPFGETAEVPPETLEEDAFIVPYIPDTDLATDSVTRAEPTLRNTSAPGSPSSGLAAATC